MTDTSANRVMEESVDTSPSSAALSSAVPSSFKLSATAMEFKPKATWNTSAPVFNPSAAVFNPSTFSPSSLETPMYYQPQHQYPNQLYSKKPMRSSHPVASSPPLHPVKRKVLIENDLALPEQAEPVVAVEPTEPEDPQELTWAQRLKLSAQKKEQEKKEAEKKKQEMVVLQVDGTAPTAAPTAAPSATETTASAPVAEAQTVPVTIAPVAVAPVAVAPVTPVATAAPATPIPSSDPTTYIIDTLTSIPDRIYSMQFLMQFRDYAPPHRFAEVHAAIPPALLVAVQEINWRDAPRREVRWKAQAAAVAPLQRAQDSWAVNCRVKSEGDLAVERFIRGILNKLTVDKFERLSKQLFSGEDDDQVVEGEEEKVEGAATVTAVPTVSTVTAVSHPKMTNLSHLSVLIKLLFEKATQQHHFIPMYAELCKRCADWLEATWGPEPLKFFKTALIEHCQEAFDDFVNPPEDDEEEKTAEEMESSAAISSTTAVTTKISHNLVSASATERSLKYRTKVWGNLKLVGRLIGQKIISSRIALRCVEELLSQGANDTLIEALAVFLTEVAPVVDVPEWSQYARLEIIFRKLDAMKEKGYADDEGKVIGSKVRFALVNLLELRSKGWKGGKEVKPQTISELHRAASSRPVRDREVKEREQKDVKDLVRSTSFKNVAKKVTPAPWARAVVDTAEAVQTADVVDFVETASCPAPSVESARSECRIAFSDLRKSGDSAAASIALTKSLKALSTADQIFVASHELIATAAEKSDKDRPLYFEAVVESLANLEIVTESIDAFKMGPFEELKMDVPKLPFILQELVDLVAKRP